MLNLVKEIESLEKFKISEAQNQINYLNIEEKLIEDSKNRQFNNACEKEIEAHGQQIGRSLDVKSIQSMTFVFRNTTIKPCKISIKVEENRDLMK